MVKTKSVPREVLPVRIQQPLITLSSMNPTIMNIYEFFYKACKRYTTITNHNTGLH